MPTNYSKTIGFWIIGSIFVFLGSLIAGAVDPYVLGATSTGVIISYVIAFVLILIGGMFWISAASYLMEEEE
ncbi:MAG TPA: hypothetical protein EYH56_01005 [Nanoarchaeota archaeon]|nr:hypothetical protein [Nanoarchaeota archaeon]